MVARKFKQVISCDHCYIVGVIQGLSTVLTHNSKIHDSPTFISEAAISKSNRILGSSIVLKYALSY